MEFLAGCAGGCAGVIVGHPLDTIKVKLQTQDFKNPKYKGTWDCFSKTFKQNGARGLYRGLSSPLGGVSAINAVIFGVHGNVHKKFADPDSLRAHMAGGATAGMVQSFICSPVELAKTRLQLQQDMGGASQKCKGPMDVVRKIYEKEGFRGVFRGQAITVAREIPAFSTYFLSFEYIVRQLNKDSKGSMSSQSVLFAGGMAGIFSWIVSYPIDVIKSRIQSDGISGTAKYSGVMDCLRQSVRQEGLSVLTRGLSSTLIRAFPTNAATFFVVAGVMKMAAPLTEGATITNKQKVLEDITTSGELIIQRAKETLDSNSNNVIRNIKQANNYNSILINNAKSVIGNSEEIIVNVVRNINRNYFFYDSYCNKMSLFNSNQILGLQ